MNKKKYTKPTLNKKFDVTKVVANASKGLGPVGSGFIPSTVVKGQYSTLD